MKKKTFMDIDVSGKRVLLRVDFNVPLNEDGEILDDTRILAAIPTLTYLRKNNAKTIVVAHLGRPKGNVVPKYSLKPVAERLSKVLGCEVKLATDVVGESAHRLVDNMQDGDVVMLENIRFHKEEEENNDAFCKELASLADVFVNDAFGAAHRAHASTAGVSRYLPSVAGFLMNREITTMGEVLKNPERPFVVIFGGAKVSDKIGVIMRLLDKATTILIGGAMAYTFIVAKEGKIGMSRFEADKLETAKLILEEAEKRNVKILLPVDTVVSKDFVPNAAAKVVDSFNIPDGYQGMDIGPRTIKLFKKEIKKAKTIVWNGPMGVYEFEKFKRGTNKIAKAVAKSHAVSIVGGGDSVAAVNATGYADRITHISTGGGATLEFLEGKDLPGVAVLDDKE